MPVPQPKRIFQMTLLLVLRQQGISSGPHAFLAKQGKVRKGERWPLGVGQSTCPCTLPRLLLPVLQYHSNALGSEQVCPRSDGLCQDCLSSPRICSACLSLGQALPRANDFLFRGLVTRLSCPGVIGVHQAGPTVSRHFHFDLEEAVDTNASEEKERVGNPHMIPTVSKLACLGHWPTAAGTATGSGDSFDWDLAFSVE